MLRSKAKADAMQGYFGDDAPVTGIYWRRTKLLSQAQYIILKT
ncbi:hypothetical protein [Sphingorhabdus sp.]|jgi:hypothetical protein